ncbi:signal peptide peptidase SppA [Proteus myxofaciens]|uniref:Protease IV n=1 Tax=Proteus myxofaciens ATCC 19692 TaxID=1354337 RepID=A0A198GKC3_9GAMM|nr:signal peptide peptidase SppA [Proteus myxofaciens]OAT37538.1 protease IV [Proteus myxofaciens ATCC 19692]
MNKIMGLIGAIFKFSWRVINFIRQLILNVIFFVLLFVVIGIFFIAKDTQKPTDYDGALLVNLKGVIVDQTANQSPLGQVGRELLGVSASQLQENSLFEVVDTLRSAARDPKIKGMVLKLDEFAGADQPSLNYIGKALTEFKKTGKPIFAISGYYTQPQYYLASYADKVYLTSLGSVGITGFGFQNLYFKSLLDKLKVNTHIFRVGTYKSAVEPLMRDDMSAASREASERLVNVLWSNYVTQLAENRSITKEDVFPGAQAMIEKLRKADGDNATYALNQKLVDSVKSYAEFEADMTETFDWDQDKKQFKNISIYDYASNLTADIPENDNGNIAVVVVQGAIIDGESIPGSAGGITIANQIRQARLDPNIKALVLRVNSPGGSVSASEQIRSEIEAFKQQKKHVVVSMGGLAASGGYWISTPATKIIASPSTLTGSIGIFGVINTFENTLSEVGVYSDGVKTSPLAGLSITNKLSPEFSELFQINIESGYKTFINLVAKSRHKTPEQVDQIAQGRVWVGLDAKNVGLVDEFGDFDTAIDVAAKMADIKEPVVDWMKPELSLSEQILMSLSSSAKVLIPDPLQAYLPAPLLNEMKTKTEFYRNMNDPQNRYSYCLSCGDIQ